jgi:Cys-tRNA(Pro) deacylase
LKDEEIALMNLKAFLCQHKIDFQSIEKISTHHAADASEVTNIPLNNIIKTLVFIDQDSKPLIAIVRADYKVSRHKLESCSGSKSVHIAADEFAEKVTGYPTGGIPPVGHKKKLPVYIDSQVLVNEEMWCGGGARTMLVRLKTKDIMRLVSPKVCDISQT